jgi:hypothetical protein
MTDLSQESVEAAFTAFLAENNGQPIFSTPRFVLDVPPAGNWLFSNGPDPNVWHACCPVNTEQFVNDGKPLTLAAHPERSGA